MIREAMVEVLSSFMSETREGLNDIKRDLEQYKSQTASELADLQSSINNPHLEEMGIAVLQKLLPYLNDIKEDLGEKVDESVSSLAGDLEDINEKVCNLSDSQMGSEQRISERIVGSQLPVLIGNFNSITEAITAVHDNLEEHKNKTSTQQSSNVERMTQICAKMSTIESGLASVSASISLTAMESQVEEHSNHVSSKLAALQNNQDAIDSKLDLLDSKQDALYYMKVMSVNAELEHNVLSNVTNQLQETSNFLHESHRYTCDGTGGWRRVVYLDMTDPNTNCPSGWQPTEYSKRTCGAVSIGRLTCDSVIFPVSGGAYTSVCGTIRGYQINIADGFEAYDDGDVTTIDDAYVSGVSLTHGSPRQHIWTFAAGATEDQTYYYDKACPCDTSRDIDIPSFVGGDYFCESGANSGYSYGFYSDDPLWDGEGCTNSSTCCTFNNPPYFTKQLPNPTTDDIEVRLCHWGPDDTPLEFIELYDELKCDSLSNVTKEPSQSELLHNVTEELMKEYSTVRDELEQVEHNVLSNVTSELQNTFDALQHNVIEELMKAHNTYLIDLKKIEHNVRIISEQLENKTNTVTELSVEPTVILPALPEAPGTPHPCGGIGLWRPVAYYNWSDSRYLCPDGWTLRRPPIRGCGRTSHEAHTCDSATFSVPGGPYTKICGLVIGYQFGRTLAFLASNVNKSITIDNSYVTGVSITRGSNLRQHVWTYAAGSYERSTSTTSKSFCPCEKVTSIFIPTFVGTQWYCESGDNSPFGTSGHNLFAEDPLWDGEGCQYSNR